MSRQNKSNEAALSQEALQELLFYDAASGLFTYKQANPYRAQQKIGDLAGCVNTQGYRYIKIKGIAYKAARLAWLYMTAQWPIGEIDHLNGVRQDDRFSNLRDISTEEDAANNNRRLGHMYGIHRSGEKYVVAFRVEHQYKYFGIYPSIKQAKLVRDRMVKKLDLHTTQAAK